MLHWINHKSKSARAPGSEVCGGKSSSSRTRLNSALQKPSRRILVCRKRKHPPTRCRDKVKVRVAPANPRFRMQRWLLSIINVHRFSGRSAIVKNSHNALLSNLQWLNAARMLKDQFNQKRVVSNGVRHAKLLFDFFRWFKGKRRAWKRHAGELSYLDELFL